MTILKSFLKDLFLVVKILQEITKLSRHVKLFDTGQRIRDKQGKEQIIYRQIIQRGQHYRDPATGSYMDFVSDWEFEAGFGYKIKKADHNLRIWNRKLRFGFVKGVYVDYTLPVKAPGFNGNECLIPDAWPNTDLKYTVFPEGVKGDIVLKAPGHPASFSFPVSMTSCTAQQEGNTLVFYRQGEPVGRIPAPYMEDANGERGSVSLVYDGQNIIFQPDAIWLQSAAYPVTVDPSTVLQPDATAGIDAYIYSNSPSSNYGTIDSIAIGRASGTRRGLIKWDLSAIPADSLINSAIMTLYLYANQGGSPNVVIKRPTSAWDELTVTWASAPTHEPEIVLTKTISGVGFYDFDIRQLTQNWVSGLSNFGLYMMSDNETENTNAKFFRSSDYTANPSFRPKLTIDYTEPSTVKAPVFGSINTLGRRLIT